MSRIGKQPIVIPENVEVQIEEGAVSVKGPKGSLSLHLHPVVSVEMTPEKTLKVHVKDDEERRQRALWGLFRSLIANMVIGVTEGYLKKLEIHGIGYKAEVKGKTLFLHVGYSHPVEYAIPEDIEIRVEKNTISLMGADKQRVGQIAAEIRSIRPPEPYKGKGIRYSDEIVRRKSGKAAVKSE